MNKPANFVETRSLLQVHSTNMSNTVLQKEPSLVLVVDDEKAMRILLRRAMEQEGYQVIEAKDGSECLKECIRQTPDIILLDAMMPVMDGFTCCRELQQLLSGRIPVLMITGLDDPESVDRAFAAGASDYVTKPIHWAVLRQRVRRLLQISQLIKELQQQTERSRLMAQVQERIRQSLKLEEILNTTVAEVRQFLQADRVVIYRFTHDWSGIINVESVVPGCTPILGTSIRDACLAQDYIELYKHGRIQVIEDIFTAGLTQCHLELLAQLQVRASLLVPIILQKVRQESEVSATSPQLWGLLIAHHCWLPRRWQLSEIEFVEYLATQVAIAIQQSQLYQQLEAANRELQRLADLDGLTGLANRRCFDAEMGREWQRTTQEQSPLSLILCDVDFFKLYNDTYGHQAGDECLKLVANAIRQTLKLPGLVARYGGEEFAVILPEADPETALDMAEAIRHCVADLQVLHATSEVSEFVSLSLGVASVTRNEAVSEWEATLERLVATADRALYQAKKQGRNCTVLQIC